MLASFWDWLGTLPPSSAGFLGTVTGSSFGLVALLIGALFNAHLNRKRDDRLRKDDTRSLAVALRAELVGIKVALLRNAEHLDNPLSAFVTPDIAHSVRVMPLVVAKLGLLDGAIIRHVIDIYVSLDQYCELLLLKGGSFAPNSVPNRRLVVMPIEKAADVVKLNRDLAASAQDVISKLDSFLASCKT